MERPSKPKPPPPPGTKPPPPPLTGNEGKPSPPPLSSLPQNVHAPPKPVKNVGPTVPIHEAIKRVTATDSSYEPVKCSSPTATNDNNPFGDEEDDQQPPPRSGSPIVHRDNPIRQQQSPPPLPSKSTTTNKVTVNSVRYSGDSLDNGSTYNSDLERHQSNTVNRDTISSVTSGGSKSSSNSKSVKQSSQQLTQRHAHLTYKESYAAMGAGEPNNLIYHKIRMSVSWLVIAFLCHVGEWALLLSVGHYALSPAVMAILVILVVIVAILLVMSRFFVNKSYMSDRRNIKIKGGTCTPSDEADEVHDTAVYCVAAAAVLEGISFALYTSVTAGINSHLVSEGFYTKNMLLQTLRFTSITLLGIHRVLRPANRIDPMRTWLELEVVSVCWDALDGSTLFQLIESGGISLSMDRAIRVLMAFWYFSVGIRMAIMFITHLSPMSAASRLFVMAPLQLAPQPTVDRTFQGLRLRAKVIMVMSAAEFYAATIRIILWANHKLNSLQQDMCIKNILFLMAFYSAYDMYQNTITREWNSRELGFGLKYPTRDRQLELCRYWFIIIYVLVAALLTGILVNVSPRPDFWIANMVIDCILCLIFYFYCQNVHIQEATHGPSRCCVPQKWFLAFPSKMAVWMTVAFMVSLFGARIPGLYYNIGNMDTTGEHYWTYNNSMLIVILSIIPIMLYGMFWSIAYMLFRREFTACPGNYNAIHDPTINMVVMATMTEGALDVLSCAQLMALAENNLSPVVNGVIVLFCLLEMANAAQCFALQVLLSGGHDDTPLDLVKWKAYLRVARGVIDFGTFVLRVVLWVQYKAVSSVFLIKNFYNLIHAFAQVERWNGVSLYPKDTLFSEFVPPADWYGMSKEEWRDATSNTLAAQARAGRGV